MSKNEDWKKAGIGAGVAAGSYVASDLVAIEAGRELTEAAREVGISPSPGGDTQLTHDQAQALLNHIHPTTIAEGVVALAGLAATAIAGLYSTFHVGRAIFRKEDSMGSANIAGASADPVAKNAAAHNKAQEAAQEAGVAKEAALNK